MCSTACILVALALAIMPGVVDAAWKAGLQGGYKIGSSGGTLDKAFSPATANIYMGPHVATSVVSSSSTTTEPWKNYQTWVYWGQIYLAATNTWFAEGIDDAVYMRIWNGDSPTVVIDNAVWNTATAGSFTALTAGWYPVEIRMYNGTGGAGPNTDLTGWTATKGFGYKQGGASSVNGVDYTYPADNGSMSFFRYDDGMGLTISSSPIELGTAAPAYGLISELNVGDKVDCSVVAPAPEADSSGMPAGYVVYSCADDGTRTGVIASGGSTNYSYTHAGPAELVWLWTNVSYAVTAASAGNGSVAPTATRASHGTTVTVTATPAAGYAFYRWTGDVPDELAYDSELHLPINGPCSLTAVFGQIIYVTTNGNASADGTSWAEATTLTKAFSIAESDNVVLVSNGTYTVTTRLDVTNSVKVVSVNGPELTTLDAAYAISALLFVNNADACVEGFTIRGGKCGLANVNAALYLASGTVANCIIRDNNTDNGTTSYTAGGRPTLYVTGGLLVDCVVTNNTTGHANGVSGVLITGGAVRHCRIVNNTSSYDGANTAGVDQRGGTVADCLIAGNSGRFCGASLNAAGAVRLTGGLMERCQILCNTNICNQYTSVGGVYMKDASTLRNCLIAGNVAQRNSTSNPAGLMIAHASALVENVTVVDNVNTVTTCDGVYISAGTLRNAIMARNGIRSIYDYRSTTDSDLVLAGGTVTHSLFKESDGSNNCSSDAPVFMAPDAGDYRLYFGSAGIDAGLARTDFTDDLNGLTRPVDGTGDSTALWDMGCHEWTLPAGEAFACTFTTDAAEYAAPAAVVCTPVAPTVEIKTCVWSFADASQTRVYTSAGAAPFTSPSLPAGRHTLTLVVTNEADEVAATLPQSIAILPATVYVSKSGTHVWPFETLDHAATNVYEAIEAVLGTASVTGTVVVAAGDYDGLRTVAFTDPAGVSDYIGVIKRPIRVIGAGPEATILRCRRTANTRISGFWVEHAAAVLSGVTICGANAGDNSRVGAALNLYNGLVTNCVMRDNQGTNNSRPPVHMRGGLLIASVITNNTANANYGIGGLGIEGGAARHCRIVHNQANTMGGNAGGVEQSGGTIADSLIAGNLCGGYGMNSGHAAGGVRMTGGLMERCVIACNTNTCTSLNPAGGIYVYGSGTVRNCLIVGNQAKINSTSVAAGLTINNGSALVENVTVVDNVNPSSTCDGVRISAGTLRNAVVVRNGDSSSDVDLLKTGGTVEYSLFKESDNSNNCSNDAPVFVAADAGDYRLAFGSAGIDAGLERTDFTDDLNGVTRPVDGTGDGTALWDMGCHEWTLAAGEAFACTFTTDAAEYAAPADVVCTPVAPAVEIMTCVWSFADASQTRVYTSAGAASFTLPAGYYTLTLVVTNEMGQAAASLPQSIAILPATVYVSKSGTHVWPFETLEHAATNVYEAIEAVLGTASVTGTVVVAAGDYDGLLTVAYTDALGVSDYIGVITRPVRVIGAGPETTILRCRSTANTRISGFWIDHAAAVLSGVTIRGANAGTSNNRVGAALTLHNGLVTNCVMRDNQGKARPPVHMRGGLLANSVITNNTANDYGIGGLGIEGGAARHCRIVNNKTDHAGAATPGVAQSGGTITDSLIAGNSGDCFLQMSGHAAAGVRMSGGLIERCKILCNTNTSNSSYPAGGIYVLGSGTVRNCLIAGNRAERASTSIAAGLTVTASGAVIENVTVVDNHNPNEAADGIRMTAGTLRNAIAWNNGSADADNLNQSGGTVTYSCFPTGGEGDGSHNQAGAPVFRNAAAGDYRLTPQASSCINQGDTASWGPGDTDLAGARRICAKICDIGAYEYQFQGSTIIIR